MLIIWISKLFWLFFEEEYLWSYINIFNSDWEKRGDGWKSDRRMMWHRGVKDQETERPRDQHNQIYIFLLSKVAFTAHKGTLFLWQRWLIAVPTVLNPCFNDLFVKYFILKILYKLANSAHFIGGFADMFPSALANYEMMVFRVSWSVSW